jgi:serine/threonine protein kinase
MATGGLELTRQQTAMIAILCHCGRQLQTDDANAGRPVRCPYCGLVLQAPAASVRETQSMQHSLETPQPPQRSHGSSLSFDRPASPIGDLLHAGQKFSHYTVRRRLGAGAMGEVWLAFDAALERELAVKIMPPALGADEDRLLRFFREARLAARLNHPHAVTIYQVGVEDGLPFLAMELVDGGSLEDIVRKNGPLAWPEATQIIRDAAAGLAQAHALGLVHRDIKPANLLRSSQGITKLADFGLARLASEEGSLTREGASLGTPAYMAPEQWRGELADVRSDLYSLACTYFFLLTGRPPFAAPNVEALGYLHTHEPFPDPGHSMPGLPAMIGTILQRGSQKSPELRYQTAGELIAALDALVAQPSAASAPPIIEPKLPVIIAPPGTGPRRRPKSRPPSRWQLASAAMLLVVVISSGLYLANRRQPPPQEVGQANGAGAAQRVAVGNPAAGSATADPSNQPAAPSPSGAPLDARFFGGDAYKFFPEELTWTQAKARCQAMGGHLVVIEYANENQFVADLIARAGWEDAWIGLTDEAQEGDWRTVEGKPLTYTNWMPGQPNNKQQQEHYALISNHPLGNTGQRLGWQWTDQPNYSTQHKPGFVCEWDQPRKLVAPAAGAASATIANGAALATSDWQRVLIQGNSAAVGGGGWSIAGDLILCGTADHGYLRTRKEYYNFILECDYQLPPSGNSGILVRAQNNGQERPAGMEIQLLADSANALPEQRTGAIYGAVAPKFDVAKAAGQWNTLKIHCERERVAVWVNHIEVVNVEMAQVSLLQNLPGFIALDNWKGQANGAQFRNIRITEL